MKRMRDGSYTIKPAYKVEKHDIIPDMLANRAIKFPHQVVVEQRSSVGATRSLTAGELQRQVEYTACGLIGLGVKSGHAVAILAPTSYEWLLLDLALLSIGAITVPIYESDSASQIEHILTDAHVTRVFTATTQQAELVRSVRPSFTLAVDSFDQGAIRKIARAATDVTIKDVEKRRAAVSSSDIATIIYTSGTTGNPKGVALTHANFVATSEGARQVLGDVIDSPETRLLLFLPVAHVLARLVMYVILSGQGVLGFSPNIKNLLPDIKAFKPSVLLVVPRVLEKVYNAASSKAGGENVSPEVLEESLATHPLIANVIVVGDQRPFVGALFTLDADMLPDWLAKHGLPQCSPTEAAELPAVRESLEKAVERANKAVSRAESIRKFRIIDATFTVENGYVTPSMKLRRRKVLADYAYEVDALYGGPVSAQPAKKRGFFARFTKN